MEMVGAAHSLWHALSAAISRDDDIAAHSPVKLAILISTLHSVEAYPRASANPPVSTPRRSQRRSGAWESCIMQGVMHAESQGYEEQGYEGMSKPTVGSGGRQGR